MAANAATELKVLINILSSGTALQTLLNQTNQLSKALQNLQAQSNVSTGGGGGTAAANAATTAANQTAVATKQAAQGIAGMGVAGKAATPALNTFEDAVGKVFAAVKFLAGGFLALRSVQFAKDLADTAARTEVLSTVLHVVARNAGVSTEEIDKVSAGVQKLGITAQSANQSLTQFLQAKLDVKFAEPLARAAQDLAVISGLDSSQTFGNLIRNIQQLDTLGLRWMGIVVSMSEATARYASAHGKAADSLSQNEKQQALLNEVIEKAKGLQGSYEAAMGNVGKQLTSLVRLTTNLKDSLGKQLLPAYSALISEVSLFLDKMNDQARANNANRDAAEGLAEVVRTLAHAFFELVLQLYRFKTALIDIGILWAGWKYVIPLIKGIGAAAEALAIAFLSIGEIILSISEGFVALSGATGLFAATMSGLLSLGIVAVIIGLGIGVYKLTEYFLGASKAGEELYDITRKLADAKDEEKKTEIEYTKARVSGTLEEEKSAKEAYEAAKKRRRDLEDQRSAYERNLQKTDPTRAAKEQEFLRDQRRIAQLAAVATAAATAREKLAVSVDGLSVLSKDFAEGISGLDQLTQQFVNLREEAIRTAQDTSKASKQTIDEVEAALRGQQTALAEVVEQVRAQATKVSSQNELKKFRERLALDRALLEQQGPQIGLTPKQQADLSKKFKEAEQVAAIMAQKGELSYRSPIVQQLQEIAKLRSDAAISEADATVKRQKLEQSVQEALLSDQLDQNLKTYQEYYSKRIDLAKKVGEAEDKAQEKKIEGLKQQQKLEPDPLKKQAKGIEVDQATVDLEIHRGETKERIQALELERDKKIREGREGAVRQQQELTAQLGGEFAAMTKINYEYDEKIKKNKVLSGQDKIIADENSEIERMVATYDVLNKIRERGYQATEVHQQSLERQLDLQDQVRQADTAQISALEQAGKITELDARRLRNQQNAAAIADNEARQNLLLGKISDKKFERDTQLYFLEAKLREGTKSEIEIQEELAIAREGYNNELLVTQTQLVALQGEYSRLALASEQYATQIYGSFVNGLSSALTTSLTDFEHWGDALLSFQKTLVNEIVNIWTKALVQRLLKSSLFSFVDKIAGFIGGSPNLASHSVAPSMGTLPAGGTGMAEGGMVSGPGTGTSDSVIARVSTGEHIMPADKAAQWMPLLEGIRLGTILPYALGGMVGLQSIAIPPVIPRRYASGGVVVSDGGAASVQTGGGVGNMIVSLHPDAMNMTMREWLEQEAVRQQGRR